MRGIADVPKIITGMMRLLAQILWPHSIDPHIWTQMRTQPLTQLSITQSAQF